MSILIVDDTIESLYMLRSLLEGYGYKVTSAENGMEALKKLEKEKVDMIISDILMPQMDGFRLCNKVKNDPRFKNIPFVFYTATYTDEKDVNFAHKLGVDEFIIKPIEPKDFINIIKKILDKFDSGSLEKREVLLKEDDNGYLREYNERLINKLEAKTQDLESMNKSLKIKNKELEEQIKQNNLLYNELQKKNFELKRSLNELRRANKIKDEFLTNINHELRTPLTAIIGFSEIMTEQALGTLPQPYIKIASDLYGRGFDLLKLIENLIDLSLLQSKQLLLSREYFNLREVVEEVLKSFHLAASEKEVQLINNVPVNFPSIFADCQRIKQLLNNLVDNGLKFNQTGGKVEISAKDKDEEVVVTVNDTGIGIKEDDFMLIFEKFYQLNGSFTKKYSGVGMGLDICKQLVELHGGCLNVQSEISRGTTFTFTLAKDYLKGGEDDGM